MADASGTVGLDQEAGCCSLPPGCIGFSFTMLRSLSLDQHLPYAYCPDQFPRTTPSPHTSSRVTTTLLHPRRNNTPSRVATTLVIVGASVQTCARKLIRTLLYHDYYMNYQKACPPSLLHLPPLLQSFRFHRSYQRHLRQPDPGWSNHPILHSSFHRLTPAQRVSP